MYTYVYIYIYMCVCVVWFTDQKHKPLEGKINLNLLINL